MAPSLHFHEKDGHHQNNAHSATAPSAAAIGGDLLLGLGLPPRRGHRCSFLIRQRREQGRLLPADPAGAGAAQHRRRPDPSEPGHASSSAHRPAGVPRPVPAVHPAAACPTAAACVAGAANTAAAAAQPAASATTSALHSAAGSPHPADSVDPRRASRASCFFFDSDDEPPIGGTLRRRKMLIGPQRAHELD